MVEQETVRNKKIRVVIIGGGISGLSTAWYLAKYAQQNNLDLEYTVLEKSSRWGGKILTETIDDFGDAPFIVEAGPDSFLTQKPWALQLAKELGLDEYLLGTNDKKRHVFVLNKGKPVILPDGVMLIVPTKFMPFALSPLISPLGKLRMLLELIIPRKKDDVDESLASFVKRRLGTEALEKIAEPLMSGIYNAESDKQSILATFPRFRAIEKKHGSLIRGMIQARRSRNSATASSDKKQSAFVSFYEGTEKIIDALVPQLDGNLCLNIQIDSIQCVDDNQYQVALNNGNSIQADIVVLTTPAYVTANLLKKLAPDVANDLNCIRYVSTGTISLGYKKSDIGNVLDGFGLVIPITEKRPINAITIASTKFEHRAPDDAVLLRVFFGGARSPQTMQLDDDTLLQTVQNELDSILNIQATPLFHRIYRWWNANPQYDLGHLERVDRIEATLLQGVYVTGSPYRGVGMPDCVHQSQIVAEKIISNFV